MKLLFFPSQNSKNKSVKKAQYENRLYASCFKTSKQDILMQFKLSSFLCLWAMKFLWNEATQTKNNFTPTKNSPNKAGITGSTSTQKDPTIWGQVQTCKTGYREIQVLWWWTVPRARRNVVTDHYTPTSVQQKSIHNSERGTKITTFIRAFKHW